MLNLCSSLLDIESQYNLMASRRGVNQELEATIRKCFYSDEDDALRFIMQFHQNGHDTMEEEVNPV